MAQIKPKTGTIRNGIVARFDRNRWHKYSEITGTIRNGISIYKGSDLSKELSANILNQRWSSTEDYSRSILISSQQTNTNESDELHPIFECLYSDTTNFNNNEFLSLFNLLNNNQEIDYEELIFEKRMKRRRKRSF